jgi:hypothetical protein
MGFFRKAGEVTNLITDRRYKEKSITELSDAELVAAYRSTKRTKASSATGIALNSSVSVANPFFVGAAVLNTHQFTVCYLNRKRVKEEVEQRKARNKEFAQWFEQAAESKQTKDMMVGAGIKTAFTTMSFGIVGFDSIGDNFVELFAGGPSEQSAAEAAAAANAEKASDAAFAVEHPGLAAADQFRENFIGGLSQHFTEQINEAAAGHNVTPETSWSDVGQQYDNGFSAGTLGAQIVGVGAGNEALQVPIVAGEVAIDQSLKDRHTQQAEQSKNARQYY